MKLSCAQLSVPPVLVFVAEGPQSSCVQGHNPVADAIWIYRTPLWNDDVSHYPVRLRFPLQPGGFDRRISSC
jgi:hypothetical protein